MTYFVNGNNSSSRSNWLPGKLVVCQITEREDSMRRTGKMGQMRDLADAKVHFSAVCQGQSNDQLLGTISIPNDGRIFSEK